MHEATSKAVRTFTEILLTRRPELDEPENAALLKDITLALVDFLDQEAGMAAAEEEATQPFVMSADEALALSGSKQAGGDEG